MTKVDGLEYELVNAHRNKVNNESVISNASTNSNYRASEKRPSAMFEDSLGESTK
jgi:hypothetical protein